ncbi:MAG: two-component system response regulator [Candidatus Sericytochromatia bacterium]
MKVLLIDDDAVNLELLRLRLEALNCHVVDAHTSADGLRLASAMAPDLIVLDMRLENEQLAGPRVLEALRDDPATFGVPVVIHSIAVAEPGDRPAGLPPAEGYLPKPFQFAELRALVERYRPKGAPAGESEPHRKGAWWPEAL